MKTTSKKPEAISTYYVMHNLRADRGVTLDQLADRKHVFTYVGNRIMVENVLRYAARKGWAVRREDGRWVLTKAGQAKKVERAVWYEKY